MERQEQITSLSEGDGRVAVADLTRRFRVVTETIRRDLAVLEQAGTLRRVHGGAVAAGRRSTSEASVGERGQQRVREKEAIPARALSILGEGFTGSVYLDAGTTTAAVARRLPARIAEVQGRADVLTDAGTEVWVA